MRFVIYGLFIILALLVYVRIVERTLLFAPSRLLGRTPADLHLVFEDVYILTADGVRLNAWFIKADKDYPTASTVLYLHGNAGNIAGRLEKLAFFQKMGLNVFIVDYRGYGKSAGSPTEKGMYLDALAAYDYLTQQRGVPAASIVIYGASLGGAAAIDLAKQRSAAALILDSTFTSAVDMAKIILPVVPSFFISLKLDSVNKIKTLTLPKLFIHSPSDETVPFALGRRLFEAAPLPKEFLEIQGGHNDGYLVSERTFIGGIRAFLRQYDLLRE